jgi:hypothetical protein
MWDDEDMSDEQYSYRTDNDFCSEPLVDDRVWESYVEDIDGGDNFADYCQYIFGMLDEEEYFDN